MLESVAVSPWDMRIWFMSLLVSLGVLVFPGKGHQNFSTWAKKGILSQKASGEWLCWNLLEQLIREAGFRHGKLHLSWTAGCWSYIPLVGWGQALQGEMLDVWGRYMLGHQWLRETLLRGSQCRDVIVPCFLSPSAAARGCLLLCFKQLIKNAALKTAVCTLSLEMC